MNKQQFLAQLREGLAGIPQEEAEERLTFYSEMIDDRTEEGLSEEEAICEIGDVDKIISQIVAEVPLSKIVKEKITKKKKISVWEIVLLVLGSPIWLSLLISLFAVILSLYISLWAVIISLWAVFASLIGCAFGLLVAGIVFAFGSNALTGIAMISAAIVCAGLSIFLFYGCKAATKGTLLLAKKIVLGIKKWFIKKEEA